MRDLDVVEFPHIPVNRIYKAVCPIRIRNPNRIRVFSPIRIRETKLKRFTFFEFSHTF